MDRYQVQVADSNGALRPLRLAVDERGLPMWKTNLLDPLQPSAQIGEASYASFVPKYSGVYTQGDLSGGVGKKVQVPFDNADADRYYFAEWMDWSIKGQGQKGPKVTTLTAPANMGTLVGYCEILGSPALVGTRKIALVSAGSLVELRDIGSNIQGSAASFLKMSTETSIESSAGDTATDAIASVDGAIAQQIQIDDTGVVFLSRIDCKLITTGTIVGDARIRVVGDLNGAPNTGDVWATASMAAATVPTTAGGTVVSFRFDDDEVVALALGEPFWIILDAASATVANTIGWRRGGTDTYTRGLSATSANGGNTWTTSASQDYYFTLYAKTIAENQWVGANASGTPFAVSASSGAVWTADAKLRESNLFASIGNVLVRDIRGKGAIVFSLDGSNWSDLIPVGDPNTACTSLTVMGDMLVICKTDSIWVCDLLNDQALQLIDSFTPAATNGQGACQWKGRVYIPVTGCLAELSGNFSDGFEMLRSIGPESIPEWDFPHGAGRVVAVAGDRFYLYAILSASGGYRLYKSALPSKAEWHGSLATIGDGTQTVQAAFVWDAGGTANPHLYVTTTNNDVADIVLSRVPNPSSDPNYLYDNTHTGITYLPRATGLLWVNPKAWLAESVTFQQARSGDYVDVLFDTLDGQGWRRMADQGGRLFDTGVIRYPVGTSSLILARALHMTNTISAQSPLLLAAGVTFAVRPIRALPLRNIEFTVVAEDGLSASTLADALSLGSNSIADLLDEASLGGGTRALVGPFGKRYDGCLFLDCEDTILDMKDAGSAPLRAIKITAAQVQ